jgi:hypothetical protein
MLIPNYKSHFRDLIRDITLTQSTACIRRAM